MRDEEFSDKEKMKTKIDYLEFQMNLERSRISDHYVLVMSKLVVAIAVMALFLTLFFSFFSLKHILFYHKIAIFVFLAMGVWMAYMMVFLRVKRGGEKKRETYKELDRKLKRCLEDVGVIRRDE